MAQSPPSFNALLQAVQAGWWLVCFSRVRSPLTFPLIASFLQRSQRHATIFDVPNWRRSVPDSVLLQSCSCLISPWPPSDCAIYRLTNSVHSRIRDQRLGLSTCAPSSSFLCQSDFWSSSPSGTKSWLCQCRGRSSSHLHSFLHPRAPEACLSHSRSLRMQCLARVAEWLSTTGPPRWSPTAWLARVCQQNTSKSFSGLSWFHHTSECGIVGTSSLFQEPRHGTLNTEWWILLNKPWWRRPKAKVAQEFWLLHQLLFSNLRQQLPWIVQTLKVSTYFLFQSTSTSARDSRHQKVARCIW